MENINIILQKFCNDLLGFNLKLDGIIGKQSKEAIITCSEWIKAYFLRYGYDITIPQLISVRKEEDRFDNKYSDYLLYWKNSQIQWAVEASTRAGHYWVYNPITYGGITGTAVLAQGQYINTWRFTHQTRFGFKSLELVQVKPVRIWRDGNRNLLIDKTIQQQGMFGINIHTGGISNFVDNWSAGCIVVPSKQWKVLEILDWYKIGDEITNTLIEI